MTDTPRYIVRDNAPGQWYTCHVYDTDQNVVIKHCVSHYEARNLVEYLDEGGSIKKDGE